MSVDSNDNEKKKIPINNTGTDRPALSFFSVDNIPPNQQYPKSMIRKISHDHKLWLFFRRAVNYCYDEEEIISRLKSLSPSMSQLFAPRQKSLNEFQMSLYSQSGDSESLPKSYIALSYRCSKKPPLSTDDNPSYPVSAIEFEAVLKQLRPEEGVWFDTGCINQQSQREVSIAINVMDEVYRNARLVVVLLRDEHIILSEEEQTELANYTDAYETLCKGLVQAERDCGIIPLQDRRCMETPNKTVSQLIIKIFTSEYFDRAFCAQELRVARWLCFLIRCHPLNENRFCRLDFDIVTFMMTQHILTMDGLGLTNIGKPPGFFFFMHELLTRKGVRNVTEQRMTHSLTSGDFGSSLCHVYANIFGLKCDGNRNIDDQIARTRDAQITKMALVLNSCEHALTLLTDIAFSAAPLTDDHCFRIIAALALASKDAKVLCVRSGSLNLGPGKSSWIQKASLEDLNLTSEIIYVLNTSIPFNLGDDGGHEYIETGLQLLDVNNPGIEAKGKARLFMDRYAIFEKFLERDSDIRGLNIEGEYDNTATGRANLESVVQTISILFTCPGGAEEIATFLCNRHNIYSVEDVVKLLRNVLDEDMNLKHEFKNESSSSTATVFLTTAMLFMRYVSKLVENICPEDVPMYLVGSSTWRPLQVVYKGRMGIVMVPSKQDNRPKSGSSSSMIELESSADLDFDIPTLETRSPMDVLIAVPDSIKHQQCSPLPRYWILLPRADCRGQNIPTKSSSKHSSDDFKDWTLLGKSSISALQEFHELLDAAEPASKTHRVFGMTPEQERELLQ